MNPFSIVLILGLASASARAESFLVYAGRIGMDRVADSGTELAPPGPAAPKLIPGNAAVARTLSRLLGTSVYRCTVAGRAVLIGVDGRTGAMIAEYRATSVTSCKDIHGVSTMVGRTLKGLSPNI